jgi:hypothetical protein
LEELMIETERVRDLLRRCPAELLRVRAIDVERVDDRVRDLAARERRDTAGVLQIGATEIRRLATDDVFEVRRRARIDIGDLVFTQATVACQTSSGCENSPMMRWPLTMLDVSVRESSTEPNFRPQPAPTGQRCRNTSRDDTAFEVPVFAAAGTRMYIGCGRSAGVVSRSRSAEATGASTQRARAKLTSDGVVDM